MNAITKTPSNATVKSFGAGYATVHAVANTTAKVTDNVVDTTIEAKDITAGFFSGMAYAIRERRGVATKVEVQSDHEAKRQASLARARELYERAHGVSLASQYTATE